MTKWISFLLFLFLSLELSFSAVNESWSDLSDPIIMGPSFIQDFQRLPLKGATLPSEKLWSGDYWALVKGSINYRWNAKKKIGFNLTSPDKSTAMRMTIQELAELSPSEKYDLLTGRYDYPLKAIAGKIADPKASIWEGMCHGWSPAAINHNEPTPKLLRNPDGIEIPFGSTDIKALLSFYYGYLNTTADNFMIGRRCYKSPFLNSDKDCQNDPNAGAFHVLLANKIGIEGKTFILDLERFEQVWNHPVTSYHSVITGEEKPYASAALATTRVVKLRTRIVYLDEGDNDWRPVLGTKKQKYDERTYDYKLELDSSGRIIGGEWISRDRPDFIWTMRKPRAFTGILSRLDELLDDE